MERRGDARGEPRRRRHRARARGGVRLGLRGEKKRTRRGDLPPSRARRPFAPARSASSRAEPPSRLPRRRGRPRARSRPRVRAAVAVVASDAKREDTFILLRQLARERARFAEDSLCSIARLFARTTRASRVLRRKSTSFTHRSVSTFDGVPFQLIDELQFSFGMDLMPSVCRLRAGARRVRLTAPRAVGKRRCVRPARTATSRVWRTPSAAESARPECSVQSPITQSPSSAQLVRAAPNPAWGSPYPARTAFTL